MSHPVLLDTGPLVASLKAQDQFHAWAVAELDRVPSPVITCEAVITEACFLLRNTPSGEATILALIADELIQMPLRIEDEAIALQTLLTQYRSVPMSLADACLVRLAELYPDSPILTLDSDFYIYRKHKNQAISVIAPSTP
ncbi:PIN domain-containing protein [Phormidesmis priestleyi ULC007]|uniref:PIN domain-containing protein n=1 Tax=Phormidesmis priestleyi ULC007 TaxID=1920490 RepID=A0A2T1DL43_9CYAN|nr:PIN domain-containing protein [Phormidesmis priestleyi]PSB21209.1 PIN domain-containing protein [Phormidesmis priestleyi ULC007]PZO51263.1 MAG: PIN domain-containing protein [Phormidesmis priestleyi]